MTNLHTALVASISLFAVPAMLSAQSSAPVYRWVVADTGTVGGTLTYTISYAPASLQTRDRTLHVWLLTDQYRASDHYREKYYGEFNVDCRTGYARELSSVFDRFGRGKPPRYGPKKPGFNDVPDVLDTHSRREAAVLGTLVRTKCSK